MAAEGKLRLLLRLHPGVRECTGNVQDHDGQQAGGKCLCVHVLLSKSGFTPCPSLQIFPNNLLLAILHLISVST